MVLTPLYFVLVALGPPKGLPESEGSFLRRAGHVSPGIAVKGGDIGGALPLCPLLLLPAGVVLPAAMGLTVNQISSVINEADTEPKRS